MNIVVCIKQVPDTTEIKIDPVKNTLIRTGVPSIMNPFDKNALETGLSLKDRYGGKVTVISMGPPQAKAVLREALAMGADEAYLVTDRAFGGSDTYATSYILSQAIKKLGAYDVILGGKQAIDGDTGQTAPSIAEHLGATRLTYVLSLKVEGAPGRRGRGSHRDEVPGTLHRNQRKQQTALRNRKGRYEILQHRDRSDHLGRPAGRRHHQDGTEGIPDQSKSNIHSEENRKLCEHRRRKPGGDCGQPDRKAG